MRRGAWILGVAIGAILAGSVACDKEPRPTHVVPVVLPASASVRVEAPIGPAPPAEPAFALLVRHSLCARVKGKVHCRSTVVPDQPLTLEPPIAEVEGAASVTFGRDFGCAATKEGKVACFGGNHFGQLGAGLSEERHDAPVTPAGLDGATRVYAGPFHACAIVGGGKVSCWGKNQSGENGSATSYRADARELVEPAIVAGVLGVTELALGWDATCAVLATKDVACWGRSLVEEQVKARGRTNEQPLVLATLAGTTAIVAQESAFCGVRAGKVVCWGETHSLRKLGGGQNDAFEIEAKDARKVALGQSHGCALTGAGEVWCFGLNDAGQLGRPATERDYEAHEPAKVAGLPPVVDVVCGSSLSCAVTSMDEAWCWGRFASGAKGSEPSDKPVKIRVVQ